MTNAQERKAQERQARRRRIQEAARTVFAERGYAGASIELIARAASHGVGVAGIAKYFLHQRGAPAGLMLGYSRLKEEEIREGIRRLSEIL